MKMKNLKHCLKLLITTQHSLIILTTNRHPVKVWNGKFSPTLSLSTTEG